MDYMMRHAPCNVEAPRYLRPGRKLARQCPRRRPGQCRQWYLIGTRLAQLLPLLRSDDPRRLQHDAVQRVLRETDEERRATQRVWASAEVQAILQQQLSRLTAKGPAGRQ
jgi:hypothetical protein